MEVTTEAVGWAELLPHYPLLRVSCKVLTICAHAERRREMDNTDYRFQSDRDPDQVCCSLWNDRSPWFSVIFSAQNSGCSKCLVENVPRKRHWIGVLSVLNISSVFFFLKNQSPGTRKQFNHTLGQNN